MNSWLLNIMMICFTVAMAVMISDAFLVRIKKWRLSVTFILTAASLLSSLTLLMINWSDVQGRYLFIRASESLFSTLYIIDSLGYIVILLILMISTIVVLYSKYYIDANENIGPYFSLILLLAVSLIGVVVAGDLLVLFLFWEAMSICAYGLASFNREDQLSLESTMKYLILAGSGSLIALLGIGLIYNEVGSLLISDINSINFSTSSIGILGILFLLIGLGVEIAIFPMQTWLPDVYASTHPPIASLFVGATKTTSFYAIIKILQQAISLDSSPTQLSLFLASLAILTMFVGNFSAFYQPNLRRLLAFSSIVHAGYALASISTLSTLGFIVGVFHLWNYGIVKSILFLLSGIISKKYEDADINRLAGIGNKDKMIGFLFAASSLAMVGSPPFGLFWSELLIIKSLFDAGGSFGFMLAISVIVNIIISIGYYYRIINTISLGVRVDNVPMPSYDRKMLIPIFVLISLSLTIGIAPWILLNLII